METLMDDESLFNFEPTGLPTLPSPLSSPFRFSRPLNIDDDLLSPKGSLIRPGFSNSMSSGSPTNETPREDNEIKQEQLPPVVGTPPPESGRVYSRDDENVEEDDAKDLNKTLALLQDTMHPLSVARAYYLLKTVEARSPVIGRLPVRATASPIRRPETSCCYIVRRDHTPEDIGGHGDAQRISVNFQSVANTEIVWFSPDEGVASRAMSRQSSSKKDDPSRKIDHGCRGRMYTLVKRAPGADGELPSKRRRRTPGQSPPRSPTRENNDTNFARIVAYGDSVVHVWKHPATSQDDVVDPRLAETANRLAAINNDADDQGPPLKSPPPPPPPPPPPQYHHHYTPYPPPMHRLKIPLPPPIPDHPMANPQQQQQQHQPLTPPIHVPRVWGPPSYTRSPPPTMTSYHPTGGSPPPPPKMTSYHPTGGSPPPPMERTPPHAKVGSESTVGSRTPPPVVVGEAPVTRIYGNLTITGDLAVDGAIRGVLTTKPRHADYAEWFPCETLVERKASNRSLGGASTYLSRRSSSTRSSLLSRNSTAEASFFKNMILDDVVYEEEDDDDDDDMGGDGEIKLEEVTVEVEEEEHSIQKMFRPGTVVQLREKRLSLDTSGRGPCLVVSSTPAVAAGLPEGAEKERGALVAFIGQTPVRCRGRVDAGDALVPSGLHDGTAVALPVFLSSKGSKSFPDAIGIALESNGFADDDTSDDNSDETIILTFVRWNHNDIHTTHQAHERSIQQQNAGDEKQTQMDDDDDDDSKKHDDTRQNYLPTVVTEVMVMSSLILAMEVAMLILVLFFGHDVGDPVWFIGFCITAILALLNFGGVIAFLALHRHNIHLATRVIIAFWCGFLILHVVIRVIVGQNSIEYTGSLGLYHAIYHIALISIMARVRRNLDQEQQQRKPTEDDDGDLEMN